MIRPTDWTIEDERINTDQRLIALEKNIKAINEINHNHAKVITDILSEYRDINARFSDLRDLLSWRMERAEKNINIALVASIVSLSFGLTAIVELAGWFK